MHIDHKWNIIFSKLFDRIRSIKDNFCVSPYKEYGDQVRPRASREE